MSEVVAPAFNTTPQDRAVPREEARAATSFPSVEEKAGYTREKPLEKTQSAWLSVAKSLIAGGLAGGVSRSAVAPLERLKILQQVQDPHNPKYNGVWKGLSTIWRNEGLRGFFKGNGTNCARIIPNSAVKFYSYEQASNLILWAVRTYGADPEAELTPVLRLAAGAAAGIVAMSATYPMDMVRGRLTVQGDGANARYRGLVHGMMTIIREEGPLAVYRGWLPSVIGVVPYVGLNFAVYETAKDMMLKSYAEPGQDLSVATKLACGAAAGTVGQTVAYPLDVVRRRMQMIGWRDAERQGVVHDDAAIAAQHKRRVSMVETFRLTVRHEGVRALYKGLLPNSLKVVPSIAIAFVTYESLRDLMGVTIRISD